MTLGFECAGKRGFLRNRKLQRSAQCVAGKRGFLRNRKLQRSAQCVAWKRAFLRNRKLQNTIYMNVHVCTHATISMCCGETYLLRKKERGRHICSSPFSPHVLKAGRTRTNRTPSMDRISLKLPYPPSVNHYWKTRVVRRGARYVPQIYVSEDGLRYQHAVAKHLNGVPRFSERLRVQILVQPPDGRARDLDNVLKCLLDSLTKASVWGDDQQIDSLLVVRGDQTPGGSVVVLVEPFDHAHQGRRLGA